MTKCRNTVGKSKYTFIGIERKQLCYPNVLDLRGIQAEKTSVIVAAHQGKGYKAVSTQSSYSEKKLFTVGKHSRQLPIFPRVNIPAIAPKYKFAQQLQFRLYRHQLAC